MTNLEKAFRKMKADVRVKEGPRPARRIKVRRGFSTRQATQDNYTVDVKNGKFLFDLGQSGAKVTVQDMDVTDRHILVNVQTKLPNLKGGGFGTTNEKWLCGHDERDWFVASVTGVSIPEAKASLKPDLIRGKAQLLAAKLRDKRKNELFKRQGEWFFVPANDEVPTQGLVIHKDEPMSRPGGGKPHRVQEVVRYGGRVVWAKGLQVIEDKDFIKWDTKDQKGFQRRTADANVYGRGWVKHPDHATLYLDGWHKILMNSEVRGKSLVFLD
jgi:hypothetical protein